MALGMVSDHPADEIGQEGDQLLLNPNRLGRKEAHMELLDPCLDVLATVVEPYAFGRAQLSEPE